MRVLAAGLAGLLLSASAAAAADLQVTVRTPTGAPVADAVVVVEPSKAQPTPARFAQPLVLTQRDRRFLPFVLVVPVGAEVRFPNEDDVRHQVYSFSPAKPFELRLYGREALRTVKFDKPGVVAVGCNIHDQMVAFIDVVDAPYAVKTDAAGRAELHDVPAGPAVLRVWHPYMKAQRNEQRVDLVLPREGALARAFTAELRTPPMRMSGY